MYKKYQIILLLWSLLPVCVPAKEVRVSGFAQAQGSYRNLSGVEVTVLETGKKVAVTDLKGEYHFLYEAGKPLTLLFKAEGYMSSQSATIKVPDEGITIDKGLTYQAISYWKFYLVRMARLLSCAPLLNNEHCQLIVTIGARGKTLHDDYQGEAGAKLLIKRKNNHGFEDVGGYHACYYGTLPFIHTNPLCLYSRTTRDGGVFVANVHESQTMYTVGVLKDEVSFSTSDFQCNLQWWQDHAPGELVFINLSPPAGPMAIDNRVNH